MCGCGTAGLAQAGAEQRVGVPIAALLWQSPGAPPPKRERDGGGGRDLGSFEAGKTEKRRQKPLWEGAVLSPRHLPICLSVCLSALLLWSPSSHANDSPGYCC